LKSKDRILNTQERNVGRVALRKIFPTAEDNDFRRVRMRLEIIIGLLLFPSFLSIDRGDVKWA
jgi:hypothetical protein